MTGKGSLICGDLNANTVAWGSPKNGERRERVCDWVSSLNLTIHNDGSPTFTRGRGSSHIDLTLANSDVAKEVGKWQILSAHRYIFFEINYSPIRKNTEKKIKFLDVCKFKEELDKEKANIGGENSHQKVIEAISRAQKAATTIKGKKANLLPYWWTQEIHDR